MTNKTIISTLLSLSMLAAVSAPSFAETSANSPKANISVTTTINGSGVKTESVNGEMKTTILTEKEADELSKNILNNITENIAGTFSTAEPTTTPTAAPAATTEPTAAPTSSPAIEDAVNINVFQIIKDYIEYYVQQYVSEVLEGKNGGQK